VQVGALTGDPARDLDAALLARVLDRLNDAGFDEESTRPLREVATSSPADASRVFGEPLPHGLRLDLPGAQPGR